MIFHDVAQILSVEQNHGNDSTTDRSISKIEYRAEEDEMLPSYEWHPFRPVGFNEREIEHVHYFAIEPVRIAFAYWNELGNEAVSAFTENFSIEDTVDDITDSTCQNQGHTHQETSLIVLLYVLD